VTVGKFDGVHVGHRLLLTETVYWAGVQGAEAAVITFDTHPAELLGGGEPPELTTLEERLARMADLGADVAILMPFDEALRRTTAQDFVRQVLVESLGAGALVTSAIAAIGAGRAGTVPVLREVTRELGLGFHGTVPVLREVTRELGLGFHAVPAVAVGGATVSSTEIRERFASGEIALAARMLGRPVTLSGHIVETRAEGDDRRIVVELRAGSARPASGGYALIVQSGGSSSWALGEFGEEVAGARGPNRKPPDPGRVTVFPAGAATDLNGGPVQMRFVARMDRLADEEIAPRENGLRRAVELWRARKART
jgi:riboflavin kinase/FMN adenylyltransferase